MAGLGQRFAKEGYSVTKPLIPVSGRPMAIQAVRDLPPSKYQSFVLRQDMAGHQEIAGTIKESYPLAVIENISNVTEGQACTALIGLDALEREFGEILGPVTFGACDNGALYRAEEFARLVVDPDVDVIVWGVRGHPNAVRQPQMFGWIDTESDGLIKQVSVKTPLASPTSDPIVIGTFTFKDASNFRKSVERLIFRDGRINGEFYIDSCINDAIEMGLNCYLFEVDSYLSWGTPNELRTFEYWQSCFHKWPGHPYRLENDLDIPIDSLLQIQTRYMAIAPEEPIKQT
jgi:hypothetical protein